ncbi:MAG: GNVR domain-containing protein [Bacteroidia bacterium]|nr:GNVR domain-containing protein [Bacteroidia bacterium]
MRQEWDLRRLFIILSRAWWWPIITLLGGLVIAWAYLRYSEVVYKSEATIQIDLTSNPSLFAKVAENPSPLFPPEMLYEAYSELFSVYELVDQVVDTLGLEWEVYSVGKVGKTLIFPTPCFVQVEPYEAESLLWKYHNPLRLQLNGGEYTIIEDDTILAKGRIGEWVRLPWGGKVRLVKLREADLQPGLYEVRRLPRHIAITNWQSRVSVVTKRGTTVLQVNVSDKSALRAHSFLRMLLVLSGQYERNFRQVQYQKALNYIDTLLSFMRLEMKEAEDTLLQVEKKTEAPFISARREKIMKLFSAGPNPKDYVEELYLTRLKEHTQRVLDTLQKTNSTKIAPLPLLVDNQSFLSSPVSRANQIIESRNLFLEKYSGTSYQIEHINSKLSQALIHIIKLIDDYIYQKTLGASREKREFLEGKEKVYEDITYERRFSLLQEDLNLRREIYRLLLERRIQLAIDRETVVSSIRVTQPPSLPSKPLHPNPFQVYVTSLVSGLVLGMGGILLRYALKQTVSYRIDIEALSPVPVLGELAYVKGSKKDRVVLSGLQLEMLRILRSALTFVWEPGKPRILVVTSTVSAEGKSYVARNIAHVYALAGHRVLLMDADLRRASLSQEVARQEKGLSLMLAQSSVSLSELEDCIIPYQREGLYLLPAGPPAPNPPELLENPVLSHLVSYLTDKFDYIIIDSAPLGLVPDTLSLLHQIPNAVTLYIFRADYSRLPFLKHLSEVIQRHHLNKVYLLFNATQLSKPHYGYGYGYGYYGKRYDWRYYYRTTESPSLWEKVREWLPV